MCDWQKPYEVELPIVRDILFQKEGKIFLKVKNNNPASRYNDQCGSPSVKSLFWSIAQYCFHLIATISDKNLEPLWQTKTLRNFGKFRSLSFSLSLLQCFYSHDNVVITSQHYRGKGTCMGVSRIFGEHSNSLWLKTSNEHFLKSFFKGRKSLNLAAPSLFIPLLRTGLDNGWNTPRF